MAKADRSNCARPATHLQIKCNCTLGITKLFECIPKIRKCLGKARLHANGL